MDQESVSGRADVMPVDPWKDDLLGRRHLGDALERYIDERTTVAAGHDQTCCIALDADWGTGKTFFMRCWAADLQTRQRMVFYFDAWAADYHTDPLIAFFAAFKSALDNELAHAPISAVVAEQVKSGASNALKKLGQVALPVGKILAISVAKQYLGSDAGELFSGDKSVADIVDKVKDVAVEASEKVFDQLMKDHSDRNNLIKAFKENTADTLQRLSQLTGKPLPMIVIIDELDRCRPSFAIELLESLKHIFAVKGLSFVVSTNLEQLGNAVCALYGSSFNGRRYLQRFFDQSFQLPPSDDLRFLEKEALEWVTANLSSLYTVAPSDGYWEWGGFDNQAYLHLHGLNWVFKVFSADLRTKKRSIDTIKLAIKVMPPARKFHLTWLAVLAVVKEMDEGLFASLAETVRTRTETLPRRFSKGDLVLKARVEIKGDYAVEEISLGAVIDLYEKVCRTDEANFQQTFKEGELGQILRGIPSQVMRLPDSVNTIRAYKDYVKFSAAV